MEKIITQTTDLLFESIRDVLYIIDQNRLDQVNSVIMLEKLNKIIIASTLLGRLAQKAGINIDPGKDIIDIKRRILGVLKMISASVKSAHYSQTYDLISLELRDSLVRWIIQIIPSLRQGLTDHQSGLTQSLNQNLVN